MPHQEKLYNRCTTYNNNKTPLIFSYSGGQRMMESSITLMQMTRTTLAINELKNNLPYIVVLTDPTTGGVTASWGCSVIL